MTIGNPKEILRAHTQSLTDTVTTNLYRVTDSLYTKGLIPMDIQRDVYSLTGENESRKAARLVMTLQTLVKSSLNPGKYLSDACHVFINQQHQGLTDIAQSMLQQLGV